MNRYASRTGSRRKNPRKERFDREALERMELRFLAQLETDRRNADAWLRRAYQALSEHANEQPAVRVH